jgi:hypothetical protein
MALSRADANRADLATIATMSRKLDQTASAGGAGCVHEIDAGLMLLSHCRNSAFASPLQMDSGCKDQYAHPWVCGE